MLTKCPECELQVSDKAVICPHCGYPLKPQQANSGKNRRSNKRKRLPNGFGQISEIKNRNLRKPFRAMVTIGKTEDGKPICKPLKPDSYFATYNEAYAALVEYNKNPYDLSPSITVEELYAKWFEEYSKKTKNTESLAAAWKYCYPVYKMRVVDIRPRHIKECMENTKIEYRGKELYPTATVKNRVKTLFNLMLDYAVEYEIVDRNYSRTFSLESDTREELSKKSEKHKTFTDSEMQQFWDHVDDKYCIDIVLIQCYSGFRPQELGLIKLENVDLENGYIVGGMKTKDGIDRVVPIHSRIRYLVERRYKEAEELGSEWLFNFTLPTNHRNTGTQLTYARYRHVFERICSELNMDADHCLHDCRKQFITMAKKYNVDEYAIKYIVGHRITDITEKVYTEREIEWLKTEIEKIK